jgi:hypothetical protein
MKTLLLMSVVFVALLLPLITARIKDPRKGIRRLVLLIFIFNAIYLIYVTRFHPAWFVPKHP